MRYFQFGSDFLHFVNILILIFKILNFINRVSKKALFEGKVRNDILANNKIAETIIHKLDFSKFTNVSQDG